MPQSIKTIYTHITWHEITDPPNLEPDDEAEVLVYDGELDDVVKGYRTSISLGRFWYDVSTGVCLQDPKWWADVPFPTVPDARPGIERG